MSWAHPENGRTLQPCGTLVAYKYRGCRCVDCRAANAADSRARRPASVRVFMPIRCSHCATEIEACDGLHGDWMHTKTRSERCTDGGFAAPETVTDMNRKRARV